MHAGSYAEYTRVAATNVIALDSKLPWEQLAALPETYTVAWSCLFNILGLQKGQSILIRGATSCLGRAAVHLAVSAGASVTATTRRRAGLPVAERQAHQADRVICMLLFGAAHGFGQHRCPLRL